MGQPLNEYVVALAKGKTSRHFVPYAAPHPVFCIQLYYDAISCALLYYETDPIICIDIIPPPAAPP